MRGWGRHLWKLWRYRLSYVLRQTQLGRNVFLVDVDTMWNRHVPLDVLFDGTEEDRRADVFFSQGTVYPPDVFDEWGFVGCMGTVAFRATPAAQTLLRQAIRTCATGTNCDDQVAMNRALSHKYGVKWDRDSGVGVGVLGSGPGEIPELGADARPGAEEDAEDDAEPGADVPRKVFEPRVTVRMWPKPFAFRSFMKDVQVEDPATLGFGGADAAPNQRCLGQVAPQKLSGHVGTRRLGCRLRAAVHRRAVSGEGRRGEGVRVEQVSEVLFRHRDARISSGGCFRSRRRRSRGQPPEGNCRRADE